MILESAILCLSLNIFHEAGNQSEAGKIAVAQVTLNRAEHDPNKICSVVKQPRQFSWTNNPAKRSMKPPKVVAKKTATKKASVRKTSVKQTKPPCSKCNTKVVTNKDAWIQSKKVARLVLAKKHKNVVGKATHFYNPKLARPHWRHNMKYVATVGEHKFYREM